MKIIRHFFMQILVLISIVTICFCLLVLTLLNSTKLVISIDHITSVVKKMEFKELIGHKIESEIYEILEQTGLPGRYVDYVLASDSFKEYIGNYFAAGMENFVYGKKLPVMSEVELTKVIIESFDQMVKKIESNEIEVSNYLSKEEQQLIHQKIEYYGTDIVEKIPQIETFIENKISEHAEGPEVKKKLKQLRQMIYIVQKVYHSKSIFSIVIIVQLVFLVLLKLRNFRFIKWMFIPFICTSILLQFFVGILPNFMQKHYPMELNFLKPFLNDLLYPAYQNMKQTAFICFLITILFICLQLILWGSQIYHNRRKKDMAIL